MTSLRKGDRAWWLFAILYSTVQMYFFQVLTGLLRRVDKEDASKRFPLGILPLGNNNTATSAIWGFRGHPKPLHLAEAAMAIVRDIKRPLDVVEITPFQVRP